MVSVLLGIILCLSFQVILPSMAYADWPTRAVTLHVASKAGGSTDLHSRYIVNAWTKLINANVAVQNYDSQLVAFSSVAQMKPDGYNLLAMHSGIVCTYLTGGSEVNPLKDLQVVAAMQDFGVQAIIAGPKAPYNTFTEMIDYAKKHPGMLSCAIATNGATQFLWGEIAQIAGVKFKMVEASTETEKLTNVAGGFISLGNCAASTAKSYEASGKVKVLGLLPSSPKSNVAAFSEYKTLAQQGFDKIIFPTYMYIFAPKGIDQATLEAINSSLQGVVKDASYLKGMETLGSAAGWMDVKDSQASLQQTYDIFRSVAESLGILNVK